MTIYNTSYIVWQREEMREAGGLQGATIPMIGAETTPIDQYRIAGIHETELSELNVALTDVASVSR
jgi:hypothetical protein